MHAKLMVYTVGGFRKWGTSIGPIGPPPPPPPPPHSIGVGEGVGVHVTTGLIAKDARHSENISN